MEGYDCRHWCPCHRVWCREVVTRFCPTEDGRMEDCDEGGVAQTLALALLYESWNDPSTRKGGREGMRLTLTGSPEPMWSLENARRDPWSLSSELGGSPELCQMWPKQKLVHYNFKKKNQEYSHMVHTQGCKPDLTRKASHAPFLYYIAMQEYIQAQPANCSFLFPKKENV